jgi:hypothetical protein
MVQIFEGTSVGICTCGKCTQNNHYTAVIKVWLLTSPHGLEHLNGNRHH